VTNYTVMWEGHPMVVIQPTNPPAQPLPLIVFMHGSTGRLSFYDMNLRNYASHGFVVVFPYIKNPKDDTNPLTTNTNGEFILKGIEMANHSSTANTSSPLFGKVDMSTIVLSGHSMGASCSIMSANRAPTDPRVPKDSVKLMVTQHPGICGPFGPPPWPSTWMPADLTQVVDTYPTLFTTATNDGAFWPAPHTAEHELGCYGKAVPMNGTKPGIFVQFSADACAEDGLFKPFTDGGHDCPFKNSVESPWVLTAIKLYAHHDANPKSMCAQMLYGNGPDSMTKDKHVEKIQIRSPPIL